MLYQPTRNFFYRFGQFFNILENQKLPRIGGIEEEIEMHYTHHRLRFQSLARVPLHSSEYRYFFYCVGLFVVISFVCQSLKLEKYTTEHLNFLFLHLIFYSKGFVVVIFVLSLHSYAD